jgi:hypothetical protein
VVERWSDGVMEWWSDGVVEWWSGGTNRAAAAFTLRSGDRHGRREEKGLQNC